MIAQLILTAFLLGILLYALTEYRRSPAVGLIAVLAVVGGLYFVWVPSHATHLADFVGRQQDECNQGESQLAHDGYCEHAVDRQKIEQAPH